MISYNHVCIFWGDIQVGIYRGVSEIREALSFTGWGGRVAPEFLITLANHLIYSKDFLHVPLFYPRIHKISTM